MRVAEGDKEGGKEGDGDVEKEVVDKKAEQLQRLWDLGPLLHFPLTYIFAYCVFLPVVGYIITLSYAGTMNIKFGNNNKTALGLSGKCSIRHGDPDEAYVPSAAKAVEIDAIANVIWRFGITLVSVPRICVALCYRNLYLEITPEKYTKYILFNVIVSIQTVIHAFECIALSLLVIVPARDSYDVHFYTFWVFGVSSILFMLSNSICFFISGSVKSQPEGSLSFWVKILSFAVFATAFNAFAKSHAQIWDDVHCHYHAYTDLYSGIAEYLAVISYTLYHTSSYWDIFKDSDFICEPTLPPPKKAAEPQEPEETSSL